jgi:hypothetical protein
MITHWLNADSTELKRASQITLQFATEKNKFDAWHRAVHQYVCEHTDVVLSHLKRFKQTWASPSGFEQLFSFSPRLCLDFIESLGGTRQIMIKHQHDMDALETIIQSEIISVRDAPVLVAEIKEYLLGKVPTANTRLQSLMRSEPLKHWMYCNLLEIGHIRDAFVRYASN